MNNHFTPTIKEGRLSILLAALNCFDKWAYKREKQKECILKLYQGKSEKSVFRGMVIPSLRDLGLIIGKDNLIRPSANGRLLLEVQKKGEQELMRVARAILLELDLEEFKVLSDVTPAQAYQESALINNLKDKVTGPSEKQRVERVKRWLNLLKDSGIIFIKDKQIVLDYDKNIAAKEDINSTSKESDFKSILFKEFKNLATPETAGIVDIAKLREGLAIEYYKKRQVLTERQFDNILRKIPLATDKYMISLGQSMGANEKVFSYQDKQYRTITITFYGGI